MRRREFITLFGGAAVAPALSARTDAATHIARVGIIDDSPVWDPFRQQLRELGYLVGKNITFEFRRADGVPDR
ncbi:MAG: ABC transporter substrate-binding protein, partial [Xanthobacteraceae bacterium]